MTNAVMEEIYKLTSTAIRKGQRHVPVHVFPFRMTDANMAKHKASAWYDFWQDLKSGYDAFEQTRLPPRISVCRGRYTVHDASGEGGVARPLAVCGAKVAAVEQISDLLERIALQPSQWQLLSPENKTLLKAVLAPKLQKALVAGKLKPRVKRRLYVKARNNRRATYRLRFKCNPARASCRKHMALKRKIWAARQRARERRNARQALRNANRKRR